MIDRCASGRLVFCRTCTAGMEFKSKRTDVVATAEKYLGVQNCTADELQDAFNNSVLSSQAAGLE